MFSSVKSVGMALVVILSLWPAASVWAADAGGHSLHVGMDEDTNTDLSEFKTDLAIYTFVVFILLVLLLWKFAFGPISKSLHDREAGIRKSIEDAKTERLKAEQLRGEYEGLLEAAEEKVREIYADANRKAEELRVQRIADADKEADARIQRAIQEIERAKDQAIGELFELETQRVAQATEHVLGRALSHEDQSRLIGEALSQFSNGQSS